MAINTTWNFDSNLDGQFTGVIGATDRLAFSKADTGLESISVDAWNPKTIVVTNDLATVQGVARNTKYTSNTGVSLNGTDAVELNTTNVSQSDCTIRVYWQDDAVSTALSNCVFYPYDGVDPEVAPSGVVFCAFEHDGSAINKDLVSDNPADGNAWNASGGVGGNAAALALTAKATATEHMFYLGISAKPTSFGLNTGIKLRLEFDVS